MLRYPIILKPDDNDTLWVESLDFPELKTFGEDELDATLRAADAVASVIAARIANCEPVPPPSTITGPAALMSASDALKIALYQAMRADGVGKADLARRLDCHMPQIDRLLDLKHASKLELLEIALRALGRDVTIVVDKAA